MFKIFLTGDNHFGKKYDRYPEARDKLIESRFQSFENMVRTAEREGCGLFVVTGDLFDNIATIRVADVKRVVGILSGFAGTVLVLPGNHDYYTGDEKVWADFTRALEDTDHNILLLNEYRPYDLEIGDDKICIWPAFCPSKHGKENNLDWIRKADIPDDDTVNIGIAHGALRGITPDRKEEYFLMTEEELSELPMQVWLLGHTHIPYPQLTDEDTEGYRIFNPGTHEQTDLHNHTEGYGFVITIKDGGRQILAHSVLTGSVHFHDLSLNVSPDGEHTLQDGLHALLAPLDRNAVVRVRITGCVQTSEYEQRKKIYAQEFAGFLSHECPDADLSEEITAARIRDEYPEFSFAARFMEEFLEDPVELRMAYELLKECRDTEGGGRQ